MNDIKISFNLRRLFYTGTLFDSIWMILPAKAWVDEIPQMGWKIAAATFQSHGWASMITSMVQVSVRVNWVSKWARQISSVSSWSSVIFTAYLYTFASWSAVRGHLERYQRPVTAAGFPPCWRGWNAVVTFCLRAKDCFSVIAKPIFLLISLLFCCVILYSVCILFF